MCAPIQEITRKCKSTGGIKKIVINPPGNRAIIPHTGAKFAGFIWTNTNTLVEFHFRRFNAQATASDNDSQHGSSIESKLEFSILVGRNDVEKFLSDYAGKRVDAYCETYNDHRRYFFNAKVSYRYASGTARSDADEYIITLTSKFPYSSTHFRDIS